MTISRDAIADRGVRGEPCSTHKSASSRNDGSDSLFRERTRTLQRDRCGRRREREQCLDVPSAILELTRGATFHRGPRSPARDSSGSRFHPARLEDRRASRRPCSTHKSASSRNYAADSTSTCPPKPRPRQRVSIDHSSGRGRPLVTCAAEGGVTLVRRTRPSLWL
jgi:hypothetical protein